MVGISAMLPAGESDPGVLADIADTGQAMARFVDALAKHRHAARDRDPPAL